MSDERKNLPSASGIERIYHCPASFQLEKGESESHSEDAKEGTLLHRVSELLARKFLNQISTLESNELIDTLAILTDEQKEQVYYCQAEFEGLLTEFNYPADADVKVLLEQRLWIEDRVSGQADRIIVSGKHARIVDLKFGRIAVSNPTENIQLAVLAALVFENFPDVQTVGVEIHQPRVSRKAFIGMYDRTDFPSLKSRIEGILASAMAASPLVIRMGDWCKYCRAKYKCPSLSLTSEQTEIDISAKGFSITPANAKEYFQKAIFIEKYAVALKEKIKEQILLNPEGFPDFEVKTSKRSAVADVMGLYGFLKERFGDVSAKLVSKCKITVGDTKELFYELQGGKECGKAKSASDKELAQELSGLAILEEKETSPSVAIKKEK